MESQKQQISDLQQNGNQNNGDNSKFKDMMMKEMRETLENLSIKISQAVGMAMGEVLAKYLPGNTY